MQPPACFQSSLPSPRRCRRGPRPGPDKAFTPRPLDVLIAEARATVPPQWPRTRLAPDLVEVTTLDPTLRLDIRYATKNNFLGAPVYREAQGLSPAARGRSPGAGEPRPPAVGFRPADPRRLPALVGDQGVLGGHRRPRSATTSRIPAKGSVHNRGCAVDLDLVAFGGRLGGRHAQRLRRFFRALPRATIPARPAEARHHRDLLRSRPWKPKDSRC